MLELKKTPEHTIDRVFLLALLALFAATTFLVVSIGAKQYHSIADSMTANYETRTVSSYLEEKMNQNDVAGSVAVTSIGAFPAIALSETVNDAIYTTYIYCYDGYLREITVSDGTTVLPGDGQKIIETKALAIDMVSSNLYHYGYDRIHLSALYLTECKTIVICKRSFHESIPPLKIQSLFDGDYFKYSVFFDSCNILCTDIFQRIPALEKHRKTASGSDRMHVDRRNLPEYGFPGGNPKFHLSGIHESE